MSSEVCSKTSQKIMQLFPSYKPTIEWKTPQKCDRRRSQAQADNFKVWQIMYCNLENNAIFHALQYVVHALHPSLTHLMHNACKNTLSFRRAVILLALLKFLEGFHDCNQHVEHF